MSISDKYRIKQKLGKQHKRKFGEVFLVEEKATGKKAVLKAIKKNAANSFIALQLKNESQFSFSHKGLPNVLDFSETENEILLVTRFLEGVTLDTYWKSIKRKDRLSFLVEFLSGLTPVLKLLEIEKIVHCDIKPSNILIERSEAGLQVSLIDFGLAMDKQNLVERKLIFPLGFAAPELLLNKLELIDHRTDIFALGIMIWRLYAGELPLTHPNPSVFTNLQLLLPIPEHGRVPSGIQKIVEKMCVKYPFKMPPNQLDPNKVDQYLLSAMELRYASIDEVIEDLRTLILRKKWWKLTK